MNAELESRMRLLVDKDEIHNVLMRYCRGLDRCDANLISSCFFPDALDEHGTIKRSGSQCAADFVAGLTSASSASMHMIGNVLIDVRGDLGAAESYFISYLVIGRGTEEYLRTRAARYIDRFERRDGEWRIAHRVVVDEWNRVDLVVEQAAGRDTMRFGKRSREDTVYQMALGADV